MTPLMQTLHDEIARIPIIDCHSHVNPLSPIATELSDLLGYHYYTELVHSTGVPREEFESLAGIEKSKLLVSHFLKIRNTWQYRWLAELCQKHFESAYTEVTVSFVEKLDARVRAAALNPERAVDLLKNSNVEAIFLTNDFDDPLVGFDTSRYVPCLRTDELVLKLGEKSVRDRFASASGHEVETWEQIEDGLYTIFAHFWDNGARAVAISLPPDFEPIRPDSGEEANALDRLLQGNANEGDLKVISYAMLFRLADFCEAYSFPFDLMIGVHRNVYQAGVHQGRDLFDQRTSLYQFRHLFNEKARVTFPVSVLSHQANQELASYAWIFPNVVTNGHWWYSNIPAYIEADLRARLEAVPISKQIGYYSDAYKLEFVWPKFAMYRRSLARVLAENFVQTGRCSERSAVEYAEALLRGNVERIFPKLKTE